MEYFGLHFEICFTCREQHCQPLQLSMVMTHHVCVTQLWWLNWVYWNLYNLNKLTLIGWANERSPSFRGLWKLKYNKSQQVQEVNMHWVCANFLAWTKCIQCNMAIKWKQQWKFSGEQVLLQEDSTAGVRRGGSHTMMRSTEETRSCHFSWTQRHCGVLWRPCRTSRTPGKQCAVTPYQGSVVLLAAARTQWRASWKPFSSTTVSDTVSSCVFHWITAAAVVTSEPFLCVNGIKLHLFALVCTLFCIQDCADVQQFFQWRSCFVLIPEQKKQKRVG